MAAVRRTRNGFLVALFLAMLSGCGSLGQPDAGATDEAAAVEHVLSSFQQAVANANGPAAALLVTPATLDHYESLRSRASDRDLTPADRYVAELAAQTESGSEQSLFEVSVSQGWFGPGFADGEPDSVLVSGSRAEVLTDAGSQSARWAFERVGAEWRVDGLVLVHAENRRFTDLADRSGLSVDQLISVLVSAR